MRKMDGRETNSRIFVILRTHLTAEQDLLGTKLTARTNKSHMKSTTKQ